MIHIVARRMLGAIADMEVRVAIEIAHVEMVIAVV
jgi:hypothetical protein